LTTQKSYASLYQDEKEGKRAPTKENKPIVPHMINLLSVPYEIKHNWQDSTEL